MSVVVVLKKDNKVCIASDSQHNKGSLIASSKRFLNNEKIYEINDSYIGFTGWTAAAQVFGHIKDSKPEIFNFNSTKEIFTSLLKLQEELSENYYLNPDEDEDEQPSDSNHLTGLIINKNGAFEIGSYREIFEINDFWAIGSGNEYALGALNSLIDMNLTIEEIATKAVETACEFDDGCGLPVVLKVLEIT